MELNEQGERLWVEYGGNGRERNGERCEWLRDLKCWKYRIHSLSHVAKKDGLL